MVPADEKFLGGSEELVADLEPLVEKDNELIVGDTVISSSLPEEPVATIE